MKVAIITGASRGIGNSAARALGNRGVGVIATYNSHKPGADALVAEIERAGGTAVALKLTVGDIASLPDFVTQVARSLRAKWQRDSFDYLVNNAGSGSFTPFADVSEQEYEVLHGVHLKGPFFLTQKLLPLLAEGGAIVNVTSATTRVATVGVAPYASFKAGLETLTRYLAKELGGRQIRANSVSPGAIRTDLGGGLDGAPELARMLAGQTALGRVGEPEDVGRVIASLLSDDNRWINAESIEVSGGYCI